MIDQITKPEAEIKVNKESFALPKPSIQSKPRNPLLEKEALELGMNPTIAKIIAARPLPEKVPLSDSLAPKLKCLSKPFAMADMEIAANRLTKAILGQECIGIETDHDCDGQTSHAVIYHNLVTHFHHPKEKIRSYIGHRLKEGYGLSESVANRIIQDNSKPQLVITADNGSSDEPRIQKLKEAGIDVIVTDHHEIPKEGYPKSALACLNPTREDCRYDDPYIAGCMVAWLLMAATRQKLIECKHLPPDAPQLLDSLDFVAVGTVADCVSMARSINNRAVVRYGLRLIESLSRPCWRVILQNQKGPLCSEDLGFKIGPLLNSDGRLSSALGSVSFLLTENDSDAASLLSLLQEQNKERRTIQQEITTQGLKKAHQQVFLQRLSLCIYLDTGHPGVHGIAASRIKDIFGRPTVFLAPKLHQPDLLTGSVRGIEGFHVRDALQAIANQHPELLISFGGHQGAGGLSLKLASLDHFMDAFEVATTSQIKANQVGPKIWIDGELSIPDIHLQLFESLQLLEPFGREFEAPIFELKFATIKDIRLMGDGTHARILLEANNRFITGVWFKIRQAAGDTLPIKVAEKVNVAFSLKANYFREEPTLDMNIIYMEVV